MIDLFQEPPNYTPEQINEFKQSIKDLKPGNFYCFVKDGKMEISYIKPTFNHKLTHFYRYADYYCGFLGLVALGLILAFVLL